MSSSCFSTFLAVSACAAMRRHCQLMRQAASSALASTQHGAARRVAALAQSLVHARAHTLLSTLRRWRLAIVECELAAREEQLRRAEALLRGSFARQTLQSPAAATAHVDRSGPGGGWMPSVTRHCGCGRRLSS